MNKIKNKFLIAILGVYLIYFVFAYIWFSPSLVDFRIASKIRLGMQSESVSKILHINEPFDIARGKYCAGTSDDQYGKIALYTAGGVVLPPLPLALTTTTTFCYSPENTLLAFRSERWIDGP